MKCSVWYITPMSDYKCLVDWDVDAEDTAPERVVTVTAKELEPFLRGAEDEGEALVEYLTDTYDFTITGLSYEKI